MALISELVAPVEEAPPLEETPVTTPAPAAEAPPPQTQAPQGNIAALAEAVPADAAPAEAPPPPAEPGPFENAVRGVQGAIGGAVAPLAEQLPEPVRNLADAVGQPIGGAIDVATNVTGHIGQGELPEAVLAGLQPAMAPQERMREQAGERVASGEGIEPSLQEVIEDPGNLLALLPNVVLGTGLASGGSQNIDQHWDTLTPERQEELRAAGGNAVVDDYLTSLNASPVPPPQLVNPLDAAGSGGPLERAGNILGAIPEFAGGWGASKDQGTLGPFLKNQAIEAAMDPLMFVPPAVGAKVGSVARGVVGRIPGVSRITQPAPAEVTRLEGEHLTGATEEFMVAQQRQLEQPDGWAPDPERIPTPDEVPVAASPPPPEGSGPLNSQGQPIFSPESWGRHLEREALVNEEFLRQSNELPQDPITQQRLRETFEGLPTEQTDADPFASPGRLRDVLNGTATTRPVPGAPRLRPVAPLTGRPLIEPGSRPEIEAPLRNRLDALRLTDVGIRLVNDIRDVNPGADALDQALYRGKEKLIYLALDSSRVNELPRLIDHEAIHALSDLGLFRGNEFATLVKAADTMGLRDEVASRYPDVDARMLDEELVAELYTLHRGGTAVPSPARSLLTRIGEFLRSLGRGLRDAYPEDVLARIDSGDIGGRERVPQGGDDALARVYHGSDRKGLTRLNADMPFEARGQQNPASTLGVFTTPLRREAEGYAYTYGLTPETAFSGRKKTGSVYTADVELANPLLIGWADFRQRFISRNTPEAYADAAQFKADAIAAGHDGVIVHITGEPQEIISFADVPVLGEDAFARQQAARAAYGATHPGYQRFADEEAAQGRTHFVRGVQMSADGAAWMTERAAGRFKYRDGWQPTEMSMADMSTTVVGDVNTWMQGFDRVGNIIPGKEKNREWKRLNERHNPNGDLDVSRMTYGAESLEANTANARNRAAFAGKVVKDAWERANPGADSSKLVQFFNTYTNGLRQAMLFNVLNAARYAVQNLTTNTINIIRRGGGLKVALGVFTDLGEWGRAYRNQRDPNSATIIDAMTKRSGVGSRPNMTQSQRRYMDRIANGNPPKWLDIALRTIAPNFVRWGASVPDVLGRVQVGAHAVQDGYRALNGRVVPMLNDELVQHIGKDGFSVPTAKVQQVWGDFEKQWRTLDDPNTGKVYTGMFGRVSKYESIWNPDDFRAHLREHLFEDMPANAKPNAGQMNRVINDITGQMRDEIRRIYDEADAKVDHALYSWRNTVGDEFMSKATLFHYWSSRQGGFYVSEAMQHPWIAAAYGRMLEEMNQQAEELGAPVWMTGFFQFQQSVAGFSTWFSPFDFVQSLLTMADWQMAGDPDAFRDLTELGKKFRAMPFFIHPMIQGVAYELGLLGPDYPAPALTGTETFGAKAIDLLNLANAQGQGFMEPFNAMGIGVDAEGNKVHIPPRPLQELYARVGNAISTALMPITGLSPVEVMDSGAGFTRNMQTIGDQETRKRHPEWDDGTAEGQMQINRHVTEVLEDPGNPEYLNWYRLTAEAPYQLGAGVPQPLAGLARIASPVGVTSMPEQRALDTMEGLDPSGNAPMRGALEGDVDDAIFYEAKYGPSNTVEGRQLTELNNEYKRLLEPGLLEARGIATGISKSNLFEGEITIGSDTYTNDQLAVMEPWQRTQVREAYLTEQGFSEEDLQSSYDIQSEFLADHPDLAAYEAYKDLIQQMPGETGTEQAQAFTEQMALTNPAFAQYVQSEMMDHVTGVIDYDKVWNPDAYLISQGVRPSVYSPVVGNEPSTAPGGYPAIPGVPADQPILPTVNAVADIPLFAKPGDINQSYYDDPSIAVVSPTMPMQVLEVPHPASSTDPTMVVKVAIGEYVGYVDATLLNSTSPSRPVGGGTVQQPSGGLAEMAGNVVGGLGNVKDAFGRGFSNQPLHGAGGPEQDPLANDPNQDPLAGIAAGLGQRLGAVTDAALDGLRGPAPEPAAAPQQPFTVSGIDTTSYVSPNRSVRPAPPGGIVYHYTVGEMDSFMGEFMGDTQRASANYVVDRDGTIYQLVDPDDAAWTHGDTNAPRTDLPWLTEQLGLHGDMNMSAIGIEIVNSGDLNGEFEPYTEEQVAALEYLTAYLTDRYDIPASRDRLLAHSDINTIDKRDPGPMFPWDEVMAAAQGVSLVPA